MTVRLKWNEPNKKALFTEKKGLWVGTREDETQTQNTNKHTTAAPPPPSRDRRGNRQPLKPTKRRPPPPTPLNAHRPSLPAPVDLYHPPNHTT